MEKSKLDISSYSSSGTTLSRAEEEKLSPETLKKRKERFSGTKFSEYFNKI